MKKILIAAVLMLIVGGFFWYGSQAGEGNAARSAYDRVTAGVLPEKKRVVEKTPEEKVESAIDANRVHTVTVHRAEMIGEATTGEALESSLVARGIFVDRDGIVVTASGPLAEGTTYVVRVPGVEQSLPVERVVMKDGIAVLQTTYEPQVIAVLNTDLPAKGNAVVALGGTMATEIAANMVQGVGEGERSTQIITPIPGPLIAGTPLIDAEGALIGVLPRAVKSGARGAVFLSTKDIVRTLAEVENK